MKTELIKMNPLLLGGISFYGDPFRVKSGWDSENEIGKTFTRFINFITENSERDYSSHENRIYEVHIYGNETSSNGCFEVFVGEQINSSQLPMSLCTKYISESDYMKITLKGNEITDDWCYVLDNEILPSSGTIRNNAYIIQVYDERFKGMDEIEDSILDVYVPVVRIS